MQQTISRNTSRFHDRASLGGSTNASAPTTARTIDLPVVGQLTIRKALIGAGAVGLLLVLFGVLGGSGRDSRLPQFTLTPTR